MSHTNVKSTWEDGNLVFRDKSDEEIFTVDGASRKITIPSGSTLELASGAIASFSDEVLAAADIALADANILVGNSGGAATAVALSGDATIANTGALTIANGAVSLAKMANIATDTFIARDTAGTGVPEAVSAANALAMMVGVAGVAAGYKVARGVAAVTGTLDVVTGLTTVVAVIATAQDDLDGDTLAGVSATIGNQSGAPAAGSITIKAWKVTAGGAAGNPTLIAANAAKSVNWIAIGV
jgi:hypothetical protein